MLASPKAVALQMSYWHYAVVLSVFLARSAFAASSNDLFANAIVLNGWNVTTSASLSGATRETGEPFHSSDFTDTRSVWWSWTAPANATVLLSAGQSDFPGATMAIYIGDSVSTLARITNAPGDLIARLSVTAGRTYHIAVADSGRAEANVVLTLQLFPAPPNDDFAHRTIIPSTPASVFGWTVGASREPGEPYTLQEASVWWQWTAPASGRAHFRVNPPGMSRTLFIFSASNLTELFSSGYTYSWGSAVVNVSAGKPYVIAIADPPTEAGAFEVEISLSTFAIASPRPSQTFYAPSAVDIDLQVTSFDGPVTRIDIFARRNFYMDPVLVGSIHQPPWRFTWSNPEPAAYRLSARMVGPGGQVLSDEVPISVTTSNDLFASSTMILDREFQLVAPLGTASVEPGEPVHGEEVERSLWWSWTAPTNGVLALTQPPYGDIYPEIIYTGTTLAQLVEVARLEFDWVIHVPVSGGQTYHLAATGQHWANVSFTHGKFYEPPANDNFANRITLNGNSLSFSNANIAATAEPGEPIHASGTERRTLWWRWQAPSEGALALKAYSEDFRGAIAVYTNSSLANLKKVAESVTHEDFALTFHTRSGLVYQIAVDGQGYPSDSRGEFLFDLQFSPAPANDLFVNRATVTGLPTSAMADNTYASAEPGEPAPGFHPADKTLWWQWTAPRTARVALTFQGCCYVAAVYQGSSLANLTRVPGKLMEQGPFAFQAQAGQTYVLQVSGFQGYDGDEITIEIKDCPSDNFANRAFLTGLHVTATNDNVAATSEPGEPQHAGLPPARTLWWTWRPQYSGTATFRLRSDFSAVAGIYTGANLASLVAITNISTREYLGPVSFHAIAGTDYHIAIGGWFGPGYPLEGGCFDFSIDLNTFHLRSPPWEMAATVPQQITLALAPTILELHGNVRVVRFVGQRSLGPWETLGIVNNSSGSIVLTLDRPGEYRFFGLAANDVGQLLQTDHTRVTLRPTNDNFGKRIPLTGANVGVTGLVAAVTFQPGEPKPYNWAYGSAWWSWTAPTTGRYAFQSSNYLLAVYTGTSLGSLTTITSAPPLTINAQAGVAYHVQVHYVYPGYVPSDDVFTITPVIRPRNDRFTNRTDLVGSNLDFPVSFLGASRDPGEPAVAGEEQNLTRWWRWVAPADGELQVGTDVNGGAYVHVYRGNSLASLVYQPQFDMAVPARVIAGRSYQIVMTRWRNWPVTPRLQLTFVPAPSNDHFANSIPVSGHPLSLQGSTIAATPELGDQITSKGSIWWSWRASVTANALLSTTGSETKPLIQVFQGPALNALTRHDVMISPELYVLPAQAGQTYHIAAVAGDEPGPVTINLQIPPAPANDHFTNSFMLTNNHITGFADMLNATREPGEPEHGGYTQGATVWYSWTASSDGVALFEVPHGPIVAVYTGDSLQTLQFVLGLITFDNHRVFRTVSNTTYHFAIASHFPRLGTEFNFDFPRFRGFEERQLLTGSVAEVTLSSSGGWWTWQAPASGRAEVALVAADIMPVDFAIYSGTSGHDLQAVAGSSQIVGFTAVAGRWYHIQVSGSAALTYLTFRLELFSSVPSIATIVHAPNAFRFDLRGTPGETFQLQTSTNLIDWFHLGLHTFYEPRYLFTDVDPTAPARFYRAGPVR